MGNPKLHLSMIVQAGTSPVDGTPLGVLGVRSCAICTRCLELGVYGGSSGWADCAWQGRWEFPDAGCDRFRFDLTSLGDEGREEAGSDGLSGR